MATARRREQRSHVVDLSALVWAMFGGELEDFEINEYIRCGELGAGGKSGMPSMPEVDLYVAKIQAAGKFVMPDPPTDAATRPLKMPDPPPVPLLS
jgi:hypothetical protein